LVIGFCPGRVRRNALIECLDRIVGLAGVGENRTDVEVSLGCGTGVGLRGNLVGLDCIINLAGLGIGVREVVVISSQVLAALGSLSLVGLLQVHGFLKESTAG
jgi:hypothetical protein